MGIDAMATRMSVLTRALPMRILLVDDDELELELLADRIGANGFEVACALNGQQALEMVAEKWFPLIITDWQMPVMDGIAFTEALRARGVDDTYVIMLTMREGTLDYERGYVAGVDDYLTKRLPDAELFARVHAAFNTIALRRSLREAQHALEAMAPIDPHTGAFTGAETLVKLQGELRRAQRYERMLSILLVGLRVGDCARPATEIVKAAVQVIQRTIRTHVDWVGHVESSNESETLAIVLPEAAPGDGPKIKERLQIALANLAGGARLTFDFGLVGLERGGAEQAIDARELLKVAEHCRLCSGRRGPAQLSAVQRSVAVGASIACRHGYAVASYCLLKPDSELAGQSQPVATGADPTA
jgi:DNA-binding response OmpR family regulator